jgi:hypothetical protein
MPHPLPTPAASLAANELTPLHQGYAFEQPDVLVRQRLFGLAHGLSLLAGGLPRPCRPFRLQIQDAYANWHAKQATVHRRLVLDLSRYYFGARRGGPLARPGARAEPQGQHPARAGRVSAWKMPAPRCRLQSSGPRYELDRLLAESKLP